MWLLRGSCGMIFLHEKTNVLFFSKMANDLVAISSRCIKQQLQMISSSWFQPSRKTHFFKGVNKNNLPQKNHTYREL